MDKYILIEREKYAPDWEHREEFTVFEEARQTMLHRYHEIAVAYVEACESGKFDERCAWVVLNDGNEISWDIVDAHDE